MTSVLDSWRLSGNHFYLLLIIEVSPGLFKNGLLTQSFMEVSYTVLIQLIFSNKKKIPSR